jgi:LEA14-like dessication related protein
MLPPMRARVLLALLVLGELACVERFVDFRVERLVALKATRVDASGFNLLVQTEIANPNRLDAEVSEVGFRAFLGAHRIGAGQVAGPFHAPAGGRFLLEAPLRVAFGDLPADFPERVAGGELALRTEASFRARTALGRYAMRVTSEGRTRIAEALQVAVQGTFQGDALTVEGISLGSLALRQVRLKVRFRVRNHFAFPLSIKGGDFKLDINDAPFGESSLPGPLTLPPRGSATTTLEIAATHGVVGSVVVGMLGKEPRFRVRGTVRIAPIGGVSRIPIDVQADSSIFGR